MGPMTGALIPGLVAWGRPWAFALLPLALWIGWPRPGRAHAAAAAGERLLHPGLHGVLHRAGWARRPRAPDLFAAAAFACVVCALAQPMGAGAWVLQPAQGRDVIVVFDTTLSMTLRDLRWNGQPAQRLAVAKMVFSDFVRRSRGNRFGIVVFGAHAATLLPPTFDRRVAVGMLMRARVGPLGDGGCLGDAIALALRQVANRGLLRPVLVVFSDDGWSQRGQISPAQAAGLARALGVRIFTVQVGGRPATGAAYRVGAFAAPQPDLRAIARLTGGRYFDAAETAAGQRAAAAIARLAPTLQPPPRRAERALSSWPLGAGMLLLALAWSWPLPARWPRRAT